MKLSKIFNPRVVIIILLLAFLLGIIGSVLISCVERVIYPRNYSEYVTKYAENAAFFIELSHISFSLL